MHDTKLLTFLKKVNYQLVHILPHIYWHICLISGINDDKKISVLFLIIMARCLIESNINKNIKFATNPSSEKN